MNILEAFGIEGVDGPVDSNATLADSSPPESTALESTYFSCIL
jgi:hypothetical protein